MVGTYICTFTYNNLNFYLFSSKQVVPKVFKNSLVAQGLASSPYVLEFPLFGLPRTPDTVATCGELRFLEINTFMRCKWCLGHWVPSLSKTRLPEIYIFSESKTESKSSRSLSSSPHKMCNILPPSSLPNITPIFVWLYMNPHPRA